MHLINCTNVLNTVVYSRYAYSCLSYSLEMYSYLFCTTNATFVVAGLLLPAQLMANYTVSVVAINCAESSAPATITG